MCILYTNLRGRREDETTQNSVNRSLLPWWESPDVPEVWASPGAHRWFVKAAQTSHSKVEEEGNVWGLGWGGGVIIWLHYLVDARRWKPSWQWKLNKTTSSFLSWLATHHDRYRDVSNTGNGLGRTLGGHARASCLTLSSNHLILMLLQCLVNQPSIYINP